MQTLQLLDQERIQALEQQVAELRACVPNIEIVDSEMIFWNGDEAKIPCCEWQCYSTQCDREPKTVALYTKGGYEWLTVLKTPRRMWLELEHIRVMCSGPLLGKLLADL